MATDYSYKIVAVIPAHNEEKSIYDLTLRTQKTVDKVIICNDGSTDNTAEILSRTGQDYINNNKKRGKGNTLRLLFKEAIKYDPNIIITIDGDGQHDPSDIITLIKPILLNEADMVVGSRFLLNSKTDISVLRGIGLRFINLLQHILLKTKIIDSQCGFRAFSKKAFKVVLNSKENGYGIESEQLIIALQNGIRIKEVPVYVKYKDLNNTSKQYFLFHGMYLLIIIFKLFLSNLFIIKKRI